MKRQATLTLNMLLQNYVFYNSINVGLDYVWLPAMEHNKHRLAEATW